MIYEILQRGEESSISMMELSHRLGVSDREIRKQVHSERRAGYPILSGINGYYLPSEDPKIARHQITAFCRQQKEHAATHNETAELLIQALRQIGGADT